MSAGLDKFWTGQDHPSAEGFFVVRLRNPFVLAWANPVGVAAGVHLLYWPADALRGRPGKAEAKVMMGLADLYAQSADDWAPQPEDVLWSTAPNDAPEWLVCDRRNATILLNTRLRVAWTSCERTGALDPIPVDAGSGARLPLNGWPDKTAEALAFWTQFNAAEDALREEG